MAKRLGLSFYDDHDRDFMNNVCKKTIEISHGKITTYSGEYEFYMKEREVRRAQLKAEYEGKGRCFLRKKSLSRSLKQGLSCCSSQSR